MNSSFKFVAHFIDILQPLYGKECMYGQQWAADLADMKNLSRYNKGVKYLLTVVNVLSKYAWVVPMKNKTGAEQKRAFESILKEGRRPLRLQTDKRE